MEPQKVYIYPHPVLLKKCEEFPKDQDPTDIVEKLKATLANIPSGVGLAAPQIGISYRIFLGPNHRVFINPEIQLKGDTKVGGESCLSVPGATIPVERHMKVKVTWFDENWVEHKEVFRKFEGIIIQHEFDHIEGKTFFERLSKEEYENLSEFFENLKKGEVIHNRYPMQFYEE